MRKITERTILYVIIIFSSLFVLWEIFQTEKKQQYFLGATIAIVNKNHSEQPLETSKENYETFFRPSNQPIINTRDVTDILNSNSTTENYTEVHLNDDIFSNPTNMILYYYSILREAYTLEKNLGAGCGSLGYGSTPYMITYNFLSKDYQQKIDYNSYHKSFTNILHLNLLKLIEIENNSSGKKYLIEIETIEGTKNNAGAFQYYYGYLSVKKTKEQYKMSDIVLYPEVYLCAPYHGWAYSAENIIDIEYGQWCHLVKEKYPTSLENNIKTIKFKTFNNEMYVIKFIKLTNDTDILIGQFREDTYGNLVKLNINTKNCIEKTVKK